MVLVEETFLDLVVPEWPARISRIQHTETGSVNSLLSREASLKEKIKLGKCQEGFLAARLASMFYPDL